MSLHEEPCFLLESLSRWDLGWRLSQTGGAIVLPVPQDFHTSVEAMHHVKRISGDLGCTILVTITPDRSVDSHAKETIIEISQAGPTIVSSKEGR